ncbi:unnamed protein product [Ostreobium quekettii]|uniref:Lycopene beta-cyclase n=1 Tax=Ostreobium quekettii TaxID=121088 RepID=A0A8S1J4X4_9CHLO|nr:unnamed protein product [Ostreobium quekettii]
MIPALPRAVAPRIAAPRGLIPLASRRSGIRDPRVGHRQGEGCGSGAMRGGGPGGRARASAPEAGGLPEMRRGRGEEEPLEVLVVGAGPSGLAVAAAAGREGLHVGVIDPSPESLWANNYGTWVDEFEALGFGDCLSHVWDKVDVVFEDSSPPCTLARPYGQVDRRRLKSRLLENCRETGVGFLAGQVRSVEHLQTCTRATCADGTSVSALLVIDATGYSRRLMQFQSPVGDLDSADVTPGYQVTYGILAEVEAHDLPLDHMVLMDWSDSHLSPELFRQNHAEPSFLYMMPFTPTSVFLEETSLVDRPAVRSEDLRARLKERLGAQGIK